MKYFKHIFYVLLTVFLFGCGPMYNTQYSYAPPKSDMGMMCVNSCESTVSQCRHRESMDKNYCEDRAESEYRSCLRHAKPEDKNHCYRSSCSSSYSHCTEDYNRCYQGCGGVVNSQQVCVAFCK